MAQDSQTAAGISDAAVKEKTGHSWPEWYEILDAAGAGSLSHREIVALVSERGVGPWWRQMVAVGYEQARGLRVKNQSCAGNYQVSASKTIGASVDAVFDAWNDPERRAAWLPPAEITIRKATPGKGLRVRWSDGSTIDVRLYPKGDAKCQCTAEHTGLPDEAAVEAQRAYWTEALAALKSSLEVD
jgi:uncharacterized protein YndB with AHSA1/START domain